MSDLYVAARYLSMNSERLQKTTHIACGRSEKTLCGIPLNEYWHLYTEGGPTVKDATCKACKEAAFYADFCEEYARINELKQ